jgi:hypothetical protein
MPKPARKCRNYETLTEFATALKVPITTVSGWTRHPAWTWGKKAPWPAKIVPDVLRWAADALEKGRPAKDPADAESIQGLREQKLRQEIRKLRAHADQAETSLARERGDLHDAAACEEESVRRATLYRNGIQNIPSQIVSLALSNGLPHEAAPRFQGQIEELVNACLRFTAASGNPKPIAVDGESLPSTSAAGTVDPEPVG